MAYKKIYLNEKRLNDNLDVIAVEEVFKKIPKIDLSYSYKIHFKNGDLYLRDGFANVMIVDRENLVNWINCLKTFVERCLKLEKLKEKVEIDFPMTNRKKGGKYYSYFFRFNNKKVYMDIREGYVEYKKDVVNYLVEKRMKNLIVREIPLEKLVSLVKSAKEVRKKDISRQTKKIKQLLKKIDKSKKRW